MKPIKKQDRYYNYIDINGESRRITLPYEEYRYAIQAQKDYEKSFKYIQCQEYYIWRNALKSYHMSTYDRKMSGIKAWQQNITIGLIRSFIDVLISTVQEKPLVFIGTPINKLGLENKDYILKSLNYVSDVTGFHRTIKKTLANGLIIGEICLRVGYLKSEKKQKMISIVDGQGIETIEELTEIEEADYPYAVNVPIFNIFPDIYSGPLRYVTERGVVSYREFIKTFGNLINSEGNKSTLRNESFLKTLPLNKNGADFSDYGNVVNQIHQKVNDELRDSDKYSTQSNLTTISTTTSDTQDLDSDVTEGLIEFKYTSYPDRMILYANNYPIYIGKNIFGFIPYVIKAANETEARFGEGIPYMLRGLENVANSFVNNYFDGARALATPTFVAQKNLLINENQLENGTPGGVLWTEAGAGENTIYRLEKGGLNDFNIMNLINQIAQQITGISEYTLGQSAGERTASGALAVTQSSNKRMSPYISTFVDAISIVAQMWLILMKKYWTRKQWIYILDEAGNQLFEQVHNKNLLGGINLSLQSEGLFGSTNELELQKLISVYNTLAPSGFFKSPEMANEIIKKSGFVPSRFIVSTEQLKPDNAEQITAGNLQNPNLDIQGFVDNLVQKSGNPQLDLGNSGKGNI